MQQGCSSSYLNISCVCRFDGLTVMHKFDIKAGCVTYRNRHLVKEMENYIREYNQPPNLTAYDDPCGSFMGRAFSTFVQAGMLQTQQLCEKRNEKKMELSQPHS